MVTIRNAALKDINRISYTLAASWKVLYRGIIHDEYLDSLNDNHWVDFLTMGIKNKTIFVMVLEEKKSIIGAAILSEIEKEGKVQLISFYLLPEKTKCGFGHIFYTDIEAKIKTMGFTKCVLDVLEHNYQAISFYKAHGFIDTNERICTKLGECKYTCKVYEKNLLT